MFTYGVGGDWGQQEFGSDIPDSSESYGPVADVRMALEDRASEIFRTLPDWGEQPVSDTRTPQWVVDLLGYDPENTPPATQA
ncbi:MAG: hypothetical protein LKG20_13125 [Tetrasphaera jenkinsii]|nr:hypothetical protein [Tetrasphaera jenkinsii]